MNRGSRPQKPTGPVIAPPDGLKSNCIDLVNRVVELSWNSVQGAATYEVAVKNGDEYRYYRTSNNKLLIPGEAGKFKVRGFSSPDIGGCWSSKCDIQVDLQSYVQQVISDAIKKYDLEILPVRLREIGAMPNLRG